MAFERLGRWPLDYRPVRYPGVRLSFRGPALDLKRGYVACMGGTETYGIFVERPWPALIDAGDGLACLNLGVPNAGPDLWLAPGGPLPLAQNARAVVLQIPCGMNLTNPFYAVHPRRNDRFLRAAPPLARLYPEVDFTEFHFTRHMMHHLLALSPERFAHMRAAVQKAWIARMAQLLNQIKPPVILLWLSNRTPGAGTQGGGIDTDPAFVSRAMLHAIAPLAQATVIAVISDTARAQGTCGMRFDLTEKEVAAALPGPLAHREVAEAVRPALVTLIKQKGPAPRAGPPDNP
ncbi:DUF6473 family protein [Roseovarius autotrophicus]|uniref:DUF6473 family protein n=1 Tax=Roseovarius autotrophicus TaxID=2824121 RepID=UPI0019E9F534|nr:DUF6473 family protein [Roseovarius autotrophicus]MBE0453031.1 hypothetical protein [Roseovarius sp.]